MKHTKRAKQHEQMMAIDSIEEYEACTEKTCTCIHVAYHDVKKLYTEPLSTSFKPVIFYF